MRRGPFHGPLATRNAAEPAAESSRAAQAATQALSGPGVHHGLSVVPASRELPARAASVESPAPAEHAEQEETDPRVQQLAQQLRDGADLTGASVAEQLGCSPRTGRRLLRQAEDHVTGSATSATSSTRPTPPPPSGRPWATGSRASWVRSTSSPAPSSPTAGRCTARRSSSWCGYGTPTSPTPCPARGPTGTPAGAVRPWPTSLRRSRPSGAGPGSTTSTNTTATTRATKPAARAHPAR